VRRSDDLKGVFFDLYGTLLIYGDVAAAWSDWLSAFHEHLRGCGLVMSVDEFASRCDGFFTRAEPPSRGNGLTIYERRIAAFGQELGLGLDLGEIQGAATATIAAWGKYVLPDPDAFAVLKTLGKHKTLALVSNFDHPPHVHSLLSELNLAQFFKVVIVSGEVGVKKPDPRIFALALEQTGLQPHEVIYVGDSVEDVEGAQSASIRLVRIRRGSVDKSRVATDYRSDGRYSDRSVADVHTISSLLEIVEMVQ
jgi:HAD superfamily hydrolase (TIGR01549 family)